MPNFYLLFLQFKKKDMEKVKPGHGPAQIYGKNKTRARPGWETKSCRPGPDSGQ